MVGKGFTPAGQLAVGNSIVTRAGPPVVIVGLDRIHLASPVPVYNFTIQDDHTDFVGGANGGEWVHNNDCNVNPADIQYTQNCIGSQLTDGPLEGSSLDDTIAATQQNGSLPEGININVMNVNDNWVTVNNRSLYIAQASDLPSVTVNDVGPSLWNDVQGKLAESGLDVPTWTPPVIRP